MVARLIRLALTALVPLAAGSTMAAADQWAGFYAPSTPKQTEETPEEIGCVAAILRAQAEFRIPDNLLLAIGIQEAGRQVDGEVTVWPWAVNAEGRGHFFPTPEQAKGWVRSQLEQGVRSIDVGCMQINLRWHGDAFGSLEEAFDPVANARYAAEFLTRLRAEGGSWWKAAGSYHSRTQEHRDRYLASLARNQQVANAELERLAADVSIRPDRLARATQLDLPKPVVLWGRPAGESAAFSLYSRKPLTPVLPAFVATEISDE